MATFVPYKGLNLFDVDPVGNAGLNLNRNIKIQADTGLFDVNGFTLDSGTFTSDGSGNLVAVSYTGDGSGLTGVTDAGALPLAGGTMTGSIDMDGNAITGASQLSSAGNIEATTTFTMANGSMEINQDGTASFASGNFSVQSTGAVTVFSIDGFSDNTGLANDGSAFFAAGNVVINADGSVSFASGTVTSDAAGNFSARGFTGGAGGTSFDSGAFTSDASGNVSANSFTSVAGVSFDSATITSDGSGNVTATSFTGDGSGLTGIPGTWVGTASSDLNMAGFNLVTAADSGLGTSIITGDNASGNSGGINLTVGAGSSTSGSIAISIGNGGGSAGAISIVSGPTTDTGSDGGALDLVGGSSSFQAGGAVNITAGAGDTGGSVNVAAGAGGGGAINLNSVTNITGFADASSAASGIVGEVLGTTVAVTNTSLTSTTGANATSVSLTAGDWDVYGLVDFHPNVLTTVALLQAGISVATATLPAHQDLASFPVPLSAGIVADPSLVCPPVQVNVNTTTVVYLVAKATFGVNTLTCGGRIWARRRR